MNLSDEFNFKIFDLITFEVGPQGSKNQPRWSKGCDYGSTGIWAFGVVREVSPVSIVVEYEIKGFLSSGECVWPNYLSPDFRKDQWRRPGYLKKNKCECGGTKLKITHSDWCPSTSTKNVFEFIKL